MKRKNINKGSVAFVFYFILGLSLLAVAGYYIGINEQDRLFNEIATKKQQQQPMAAYSLHQGGDGIAGPLSART